MEMFRKSEELWFKHQLQNQLPTTNYQLQNTDPTNYKTQTQPTTKRRPNQLQNADPTNYKTQTQPTTKHRPNQQLNDKFDDIQELLMYAPTKEIPIVLDHQDLQRIYGSLGLDKCVLT